MATLKSMPIDVLSLFLGSKQSRDLKSLAPLVRRINALEPECTALPTAAFAGRTAALRQRLADGVGLEEMLPEAFALVREAARRALGERIYDVQLMGGIILHQGRIMEMKTGEGKTLSSVTAAYLNCLTGAGVHVVTVNDYLAERDAEWMGRIYRLLGVTVGVVLSQLDNEGRKAAYGRDITYGTNNEFGFDYLRDNMRWEASGKVQRGHNFCIIDEIDSILIDEARTPLIISGAAEDDTQKYYEANKLVEGLEECAKDPATGEYPEESLSFRMEKPVDTGDFKIDEKNKRVSFTDRGFNHIEELAQRRGLIHGSLFESDNFEFIHYATQALRAKRLFHKDVDYVVNEGRVDIVDEFTGRILHGRRYSEGLHQAIEAKENIRIAERNRTLATITFQNYFRMYKKLSGMTGTAETEATEFAKIYGLDVAVIPTNRPVLRGDADDLIYLNEEEKLQAIGQEIVKLHRAGQPVLVGTISIEKSEKVSRLLTGLGVRHEVLNAKNHAREALIIAEAGARGAITIATNMAGRGTDIKLGGNPEFRARRKLGDQDEEALPPLLARELASWEGDYSAVKGFGGLHVLGTERHDARRIDNQLRGRSGRQGDPGSSRFYISLDDDLMRLFGGENLKGVMSRLGMKEGEPIYHPWVNKAIERAQKRVEERNFEIRKHLLEYDDVLNEQRKFIYSRRDEILADELLSHRVLGSAMDVFEGVFEELGHPEGAKRVLLLARLKEALSYTPRDKPEAYMGLSPGDLRERIRQDLTADLREKETEVGPEHLNLFLRFEYLRNIDQRWQDHLESLEALREAVYLRAYGQKNPLLEYKLEGFQIFDRMLEDIRTALARKGPAAAPAARGRPASGELREAQPERLQVRRTYPKVGRNDPCPCGSGKKYKYCHGS
jgi:preprotein translocase subunit SecA